MTIYVVTGGAGFIGSNIAERLLKEGHTVRIVDNLSTGKRSNLDALQGLGDLQFHQVSITDKAALDPIFKGAEVVFHQAALASVSMSVENPLATHEHCVTGTLNVLLAARDAGVRRVVYAASSAAYGDAATDVNVETMAPAPISPYGVAKLAGEYYCQAFASTYGLETVCLRYFNVFGSRQDPTSQYAAVIPIFISAMLKNKRPTIFGDGQQSRDFIHIDNVVHGNILASQAPNVSGQMMNLATGSSVSLLELISKLNTILETSIEPIHVEARSGDIKHSRANIEKVQELLDFAPIVEFDEGLRRTVAWYRSQNNV
jgi:UDP-glucose 4-epimerase